MESTASVSNINYELGTSLSIDGLDFLANDQEKLKMYKLSGLSNYLISDLHVLDLCYNSIIKTLKESSIPYDSIDFVIYVSENANKDYCINIRDINFLLLKIGLKNAFPIGVSLSDCANILTGIQIGASLISSRMAKKILLVSSDKVLKESSKRKMMPEMSILSDAAVSCIISEPGTGLFDIKYITNKNIPSQWEINREKNQTQYSMEKFKGLLNVSKQFLNMHSLKPTDIKKIITSNYLKHISKMFVEMAGFKAEQGYYENIQRFGHTIAGDVLINLKDYTETENLNPRDKIFIMADSYSSCGSCLLIKN